MSNTSKSGLLQGTYNLGCDPEIFFERDGHVIGAERVIDEQLKAQTFSGTTPKDLMNNNAVILDGVQAELNPMPHYCREELGGEISCAFRALRQHLGSQKGVSISMKSVVDVDGKELAALSEKARQLGCAPSKNARDMKATITVDPTTYTKRSAGGHIHLGNTSEWFLRNRDKIVDVMDVVLGNTCVLIDRDPGAAERRQVYGRAGEYREPKHGLEYRTLSNFWLHAYPLMSLVMGLSRFSADIMYTTVSATDPYSSIRQYGWDAYTHLMSHIDMDKVAEAINTNNYDLAMSNFKVIRPFLMANLRGSDGLVPNALDAFEHFAGVIKEKGLKAWFPYDPVSHWCDLPGAPSGRGAESFFTNLNDRLVLKRLNESSNKSKTVNAPTQAPF